jgi:hypothetical protein
MRREFLLMLLFVLLPLASAQIIFQNTFGSVYNVGEVINSTVSVSRQISMSDYLDSYLVCAGVSKLVSRDYLKLNPNQAQTVNIDFPASMEGQCYFNSVFDGESQKSENFLISSNININYHLNDLSFFPGDNFSLNGSAIKNNNEPLNGVLILSSPEIVNKTIAVTNGNFEYSFPIRTDSAPGDYNLSLNAIEYDSNNNVINSGKEIVKIKIKSLPTLIKVNPNSSEISPPQRFNLSFALLDQAGRVIDGKNVLMKVFDPDNNITFDSTLGNQGNYSYYFPGNSTKGFWSFNFYYGSLFSTAKVYVNENENYSLVVLNQSDIRIINNGNVPYTGIVTYSISNSSWNESYNYDVNLDVGEYKDYPLNLDGSYNLSSQGVLLGGFTFTGAAVADNVVSIRGNSLRYLLLGLGVAFLIGVFFALRKNKLFSKNKKQKTKSDIVASSGAVSGIMRRRAYMGFFHFDEFFEGARKLLKKYGWTLHRVNDKMYFVLFYSSRHDSSEKLVKFSKELKRIAKDNNRIVNISLNSTNFNGDAAMLKKFASETRKMINYSEGKIILSKTTAKIAGIDAENTLRLDIDGKIVEACVI